MADEELQLAEAKETAREARFFHLQAGAESESPLTDQATSLVGRCHSV